MQDETHNQNQGLDTPDTAPSRTRVIGIAILAYALVACMVFFFLYQPGESMEQSAIKQDQTPTPLANSGAFPKGLYYAPANGRLLIPEQIAFANLEPANDIVSSATALGTYPEINVIFVDPRQLANGDAAWLRQQYDQGKVIVGLNIPHQTFGAWLDLSVMAADLDTETTRNSVSWAFES